MSDGVDEGCGLPEVIETEQVVEIMDESQLLDFAASMETRGEMVATLDTPTSCSHFADSVHEIVGAGSRQLAGHKRRRDDCDILEEAGLLSFPLPTAIVPPSPRQVIATPLQTQLPLPSCSHSHQLTAYDVRQNTLHQEDQPTNTSPNFLPAVNIQLTSDELQALFSILRQRTITPDSLPITTTSAQQTHQLIAPKKLVTAVVMPSTSPSPSSPPPSSSSFPISYTSNRTIIEAQTVAAAKASVQGKKRHCSCKNSQCLKLYCDCFSHEESCSMDCSCRNCRNNPAFSEMRDLTVKMYKGRDPTAFHHPKPGYAAGQRSKGCKCRKTLCIKKYCECFHSGVHCSTLCRCINCKNTASLDSQLLNPSPSSSSSVTTNLVNNLTGSYPQLLPVVDHPSHVQPSYTYTSCSTTIDNTNFDSLTSSSLKDTVCVYRDSATINDQPKSELL